VGYTIRHLKDGLYKLTLSKVGTRSNQSNRYYRGVVLQLIAEYTGQTKEELHEYFKQMFLYSEENSTTEKNQSDF
jgi:hypothetical protein